MTLTGLLGLISGIGAIIGGLVYLVKTGTWLAVKTPAQKAQDIDKSVEAEKTQVDAGGRPKWD